MLGSYNKTQKDCKCQAEMQILFEEFLKVFEQEDDMILTELQGISFNGHMHYSLQW